MQKIRIKNIKPYTTKTGKQMYFIETVDGQSYSTFDTIEWKEGEEIEGTIEISEQKDRNGNPYKSFKLPRKTDMLEERVKKLEDAVFGDRNDPVAEAESEMSVDDIPF